MQVKRSPDSPAVQALGLLPSFLAVTDAGTFCNLLCTSKALHKHLLQPGICRHLDVHIGSAAGAFLFGTWLPKQGHTLLSLSVECNIQNSTFAAKCINMGLLALPVGLLTGLAIDGVDLQPAVLAPEGLKGLQELTLSSTGVFSLLHVSHLTSLTSFTVGKRPLFSEVEDTGFADDDQDTFMWETHLKILRDYLLQPPTSLKRVATGRLGDALGGEYVQPLTSLTNLTSLEIDSVGESFRSVRFLNLRLPKLPVTPGLLELGVRHCEVLPEAVSFVGAHYTALTKLHMPCQYGAAAGLPAVLGNLRHLRDLRIDCFGSRAESHLAKADVIQHAPHLEKVRFTGAVFDLAAVSKLSSLSCLRSFSVQCGGGAAGMCAQGLAALLPFLPGLTHVRISESIPTEGLDGKQDIVYCCCLDRLLRLILRPTCSC